MSGHIWPFVPAIVIAVVTVAWNLVARHRRRCLMARYRVRIADLRALPCPACGAPPGECCRQGRPGAQRPASPEERDQEWDRVMRATGGQDDAAGGGS